MFHGVFIQKNVDVKINWKVQTNASQNYKSFWFYEIIRWIKRWCFIRNGYWLIRTNSINAHTDTGTHKYSSSAWMVCLCVHLIFIQWEFLYQNSQPSNTIRWNISRLNSRETDNFSTGKTFSISNGCYGHAATFVLRKNVKKIIEKFIWTWDLIHIFVLWDGACACISHGSKKKHSHL